MVSNKSKIIAITCLTGLIPLAAYGNVVWPALYAEAKVNSVPIIALSLVLEFFVIKALFKRDFKTSVFITLVINLVSGLAGLLLRPLTGLAWEFTLGSLLIMLLDWGTFNPVSWFFVPIIGGAINAALELFTVKIVWKEQFSKKNYLALWAINWLTVGIATLWVVIAPPPV